MRLGMATDHGGLHLKAALLRQLRAAEHEVVDFGAPRLSEDDDYPDYVVPLARAVAALEVERGVAICGSGVGASVCANKVQGIRAALIHDHFSARQGVEDDHLHILCSRTSPGASGGQRIWDRRTRQRWPTRGRETSQPITRQGKTCISASASMPWPPL